MTRDVARSQAIAGVCQDFAHQPRYRRVKRRLALHGFEQAEAVPDLDPVAGLDRELDQETRAAGAHASSRVALDAVHASCELHLNLERRTAHEHLQAAVTGDQRAAVRALFEERHLPHAVTAWIRYVHPQREQMRGRARRSTRDR